MLRIILMLILVCSTPAFAQNSFDSVRNHIMSHHTEAPVKVTDTKLEGTITYAGEKPEPFSLQLQRMLLRFDVIRDGEAVTIVRRGEQSQVIRGERIRASHSSPFAHSAMNMIPAFALVNFEQDPRYIGSTVEDREGNVGLQFVSSTASESVGVGARLLDARVTFWSDESGQITEVDYRDTDSDEVLTSYRYIYEFAIGSPYLQPSAVICESSGGTVYEATFSSLRTDAPAEKDTFEIRR